MFLLLWVAQLGGIWLATGDGGPVTRWRTYWRLRAAYRPALAALDHAVTTAADAAESDALRLGDDTFHPLSRGGATRAFVAASGLYAGLGATILISTIGVVRRVRTS